MLSDGMDWSRRYLGSEPTCGARPQVAARTRRVLAKLRYLKVELRPPSVLRVVATFPLRAARSILNYEPVPHIEMDNYMTFHRVLTAIAAAVAATFVAAVLAITGSSNAVADNGTLHMQGIIGTGNSVADLGIIGTGKNRNDLGIVGTGKN